MPPSTPPPPEATDERAPPAAAGLGAPPAEPAPATPPEPVRGGGEGDEGNGGDGGDAGAAAEGVPFDDGCAERVGDDGEAGGAGAGPAVDPSLAPERTSAVVREHLRGLLEALLFLSNEPVGVAQLAGLAQADRKVVRELLAELREFYRPRGLRLDEVAGGWLFRTNPAYAPFLRELTGQKPVKMTRAQIETLAIVAYRQPVTRPEVDEVRGVDSGPVLKALLERDLVRIMGKKEEPGRPLLYGTTSQFLHFFGLSSLRDLPTLREFTELTDDSRVAFTRETGEEAPAAGVVETGLAGGEGHFDAPPPDRAEGAPVVAAAEPASAGGEVDAANEGGGADVDAANEGGGAVLDAAADGNGGADEAPAVAADLGDETAGEAATGDEGRAAAGADAEAEADVAGGGGDGEHDVGAESAIGVADEARVDDEGEARVDDEGEARVDDGGEPRGDDEGGARGDEDEPAATSDDAGGEGGAGGASGGGRLSGEGAAELSGGVEGGEGDDETGG